MNYENGELKTTERIEDENWYSDYQVVEEIMFLNMLDALKEKDIFFERNPNGLERVKKLCNIHFKYYNREKSDEQLERWIKSLWLSEEQIQELEKGRLQNEEEI